MQIPHIRRHHARTRPLATPRSRRCVRHNGAQAGRAECPEPPRGKACYASAPRACSAVRHQLKGRRELAGSVSARRSSRRTVAAANPGPAAWCRSAAGPPACAGSRCTGPRPDRCALSREAAAARVCPGRSPAETRPAFSPAHRAATGQLRTVLAGRRRCWKRYECQLFGSCATLLF